MECEPLPTLTDFTELIVSTDPDRDYHLPLLEQAAPILYGETTAPLEQCETLADRFERWRYQILNHHDGKLAPPLRELTEALCRSSAALRGFGGPLRNPRAVLHTAADALGEQSLVCLDPKVPLETVTEWAAQLTAQHFTASSVGTGSPATVAATATTRRRILLYAPIYLSSYCINRCLYCSFRFSNDIEREHLSLEEALAQAEILQRRGFQDLLLVAGDFPKLTSTPYFVGIVQALAARGHTLAVEIAPLSTAGYTELVRAGAGGVTLYQETYQEDLYAHYHPRGTKAAFDWRLEGPERAAEAGMHRLGLGILLGLADPLQDLFAMAAHGRYLQERFPAVQLAFSLPRIHEGPEGFEVSYNVTDETFIRMYCALRLAFPTSNLVLSTREQPELRNRLTRICITQASAGSSTAPGGYGEAEANNRHRDQFPVVDQRSAAEVAAWLMAEGFEVHWRRS